MRAGDVGSRARTTSRRRLRRHSMLLLVFVVAAGLWVAVVLVGWIRPGPPNSSVPVRTEATATTVFWKDDRAVAVGTVLDRISYWTHHRPRSDPEFELVAPGPDEGQYLTFEPDRGGFNNIRMQLEILVQIARATRRTLVVPPDLPWAHLDGTSNVADYFQLDRTADFIDVVDIDTYLGVAGAGIRSRTAPADAIFAFLRDHAGSYSPAWDPDREALVFGPDDDDDAAPERVPSAAQFLAGRRPIRYDRAGLGSYRNLHFRSDYDRGYRLLAVPCTFVYYPTLEWERYAQALIRDGFHYRNDIFAAAAPVRRPVGNPRSSPRL